MTRTRKKAARSERGEKKLNVWWMIRDPAGEYAYYAPRHTAEQCIEDFVRDCQAPHREPPYRPTWDDLTRDGYSVRRVEIREVKE